MEKDDDIPLRIETKYKMSSPNEKILLYEGASELSNQKKKVVLENTKIYYEWFPRLGAKVYFRKSFNKELSGRFFTNEDKYELIIEGLLVGRLILTDITIDDNYDCIGVLGPQTYLGEKSIECSEVSFVLPNMKSITGHSVKTKTEKGTSYSKSRINLEDGKYLIQIDKVEQEQEEYSKLRKQGGYLKTYDGLIKSASNKSISAKDIENLSKYLDLFFTFINGRRIASVLYSGCFDGDTNWIDISKKNISIYESSFSWIPKNDVAGIEMLWKNFREHCKNLESFDVISTVIHWYIESNNYSGAIEGSIIMSQSALELLYNYYIVESKRAIIGKDSESISASNKIRLLVSGIESIDLDNLGNLTELKNFTDNSDHFEDVIDSITFIRNSVVHSQKKKRIQLNKISYEVRLQALKMNLYLIELSLLHILSYKGKVRSRIMKTYITL